jgi:broad specificity phosphatase PhoE
MPNISAATMVIIIRHAEKDTSNPNDQDPHLSKAGKTRAQTLVHVVGKAGIKAIYTSRFIRTQETARPLATQLGLSTTQIDDAPKLKQDILSKHAGEVVLVVGHSDSGPALINLLGGGGGFQIEEKAFDKLFVVTVTTPDRAVVTQLRYGLPTPA